MNYFANNFGFTPDEVVALMGAHNVGVASTQNSGFQVLKETVYKILILCVDFTREPKKSIDPLRV
jgi:Peroxidase